MEKGLLITAPNFAGGYFAQLEGRKPTELSQPSANTRLTRQGEAYTRPGYADTGVSLGMAGKSNVMGYRQERPLLTWFAGGTKLVYCKDSGVPSAPFSAPVDSGLALTDGQINSMAEYVGDLFITNAVDGLHRVAVCTLGTSASSGDTFLNLSTADGFRINASGTLRIAGVNMAYSSRPAQVTLASLTEATTTATGTTTADHGLITGMQVSISGAADNKYNGTFTVTGTPTTKTFTYTTTSGAASPDTGSPVMTSDAVACTTTVGANYAAGEIALFIDPSITTTAPKGSKIEFWLESAHVIGVQPNFKTNYMAPLYSWFYADAAQGNVSGGLAKAYTFTGGSAGTNLVGRKGVLKNILSMNDYILLFTDRETYKLANSDVTVASGVRTIPTPRLFSPSYGCANEFAAAVMETRMVYLAKNKKRIIATMMGQQTSFSYASIVPDEQFDRPMFEILQLMDDDQSKARLWYWTLGRLLFCQIKVQGQYITLVYDNNVGVWLPPDTNKSFNSYFEVFGQLYATQATDQTVYHVEYGSSDNLSPIDWNVSTGILRAAQGEGEKGLATCDFQEAEFVGSISQGTNLKYQATVDVTNVGTQRIMPQSAATFSSGQNIGNIQIGTVSVGGNQMNPDRAPASYSWLNSPSVGFGIQLSWSCIQDGGAASVKTYNVNGVRFSDSFLTSH